MPAEVDLLTLSQSDADQIADDPCVAVLQDYQAALETGHRPDRGPFLARVSRRGRRHAGRGDGRAGIPFQGRQFLTRVWAAIGVRRAADPVASSAISASSARSAGAAWASSTKRSKCRWVGGWRSRSCRSRRPSTTANCSGSRPKPRRRLTSITPTSCPSSPSGPTAACTTTRCNSSTAGRSPISFGNFARPEKPCRKPLPLDEDGSVPSGTTIQQPAEPPACGSTAERAALTHPAQIGCRRPACRGRGPAITSLSPSSSSRRPTRLEYAHSMGVVHRDVKPANLLVDARAQPLGRRLRTGPVPRRRADGHRRRARHAAVHEPGTGGRPPRHRRPPHRHLFAGHQPLRVGHVSRKRSRPGTGPNCCGRFSTTTRPSPAATARNCRSNSRRSSSRRSPSGRRTGMRRPRSSPTICGGSSTTSRSWPAGRRRGRSSLSGFAGIRAWWPRGRGGDLLVGAVLAVATGILWVPEPATEIGNKPRSTWPAGQRSRAPPTPRPKPIAPNGRPTERSKS